MGVLIERGKNEIDALTLMSLSIVTKTRDIFTVIAFAILFYFVPRFVLIFFFFDTNEMEL